jgi:hypothetical protein
MTDAEDWQCSDCGTLINGPETRKCSNCGGINFYSLADEVPGGQDGTVTIEIDLDEALDHLTSEES